MSYYANMTLALEILALVSATALLIWAGKEGAYKGLAKAVAVLAMIGSALAIICTVTTAIKHGGQGTYCPYHHDIKGMTGMDHMHEGTSQPEMPSE